MASNRSNIWYHTSEQEVRQQERHRINTLETPSISVNRPFFSTAKAQKASIGSAAENPIARSETCKRQRDGERGQADEANAVKRRAVTKLPWLPSHLEGSTIDKLPEECPNPGLRPDVYVPSSTARGLQLYPTSSVPPTAAADPLLFLNHSRYGLPNELVTNLANLGIRSIYPWQKQCLLGCPGLLKGTKNLIYAAPTGGGKSLVADILMLRQVLQEGKSNVGMRNRPKALLVLPFVALVQEKVQWLRSVVQGDKKNTSLDGNGYGLYNNAEAKLSTSQLPLQQDSIRVAGFFGGAKMKASWADFDIGVATIEKANALINTAIDDCSIADLKVVVLDELHMLNDTHRGYLLELLASKLLCLDHHVQIIGMSATLKNIDLFAKWLSAYSFETHYRPIPIAEHIVFDGNVYAIKSPIPPCSNTKAVDEYAPSDGMQLTRVVRPSKHRELKDSVINDVVALANETARAGYGALVFASSRAACESDAFLISRVLPTHDELQPAVLGSRVDLLCDLQNLGNGLDSKLSGVVLAGIGFHHAGMTTEERSLIANAFDKGVLKVCVATCGLAAGINLPARRVILHNVRMGRDLISPAMLRQMRGRAGRKGKDEVGETYICCRRPDSEQVMEIMRAELPKVSSCLLESPRNMQRALLEVICIHLATSRDALQEYIGRTMLYHESLCEGGGTGEQSVLWAEVTSGLEALRATGFVEIDDFENYKPTRFGKAVVMSALDPNDATFIRDELQRALQAFVLDGEMHVLYTFTPVPSTEGTRINWLRYWKEMEDLDESGLRVLQILGLKPHIITKMLHGGTLSESTAEDKQKAKIYKRFYLALQLRDLCNEIPIQHVAEKYDSPRGAVQNLAQSCEGFAAAMIKFCEQMGWQPMASILEHFVDRLKAGAKADLLALAKIAYVKSHTATFWDSGFKTVAAVANANPLDLVPVLMQAQASKTKFVDNHEKYMAVLLEKARIITESANKRWQIEMQKDIGEEE